MSKNAKKLTLVCFLFAMFLGFYNMSSVYANEVETFNTSNMTEENISIVIEGTELVFKSFPKREEFNYVMLSLYGEDGQVHNKQMYSTASEIRYSVANIANGTYYIQIYKAPKKYTTYWSYMYGKRGIKVEIKDGKVLFVDSPVLENNRKLYESNMSTKEALAYYLKPSYGVDSDDKTITELAKSIVNESDSAYEKVKKVHDWVANNIWYNWDGFLGGDYGKNDVLSVLETKRAVCQGYANLSAALLRALGIPTKVVSGYALGVSGGDEWTGSLIIGNQSNHAWNESYVDGKWIIFDVTWDSNNRYENGAYSTDTGLEGYKYFNPTIEQFSYDHKMVGNESYVYELDSKLINSVKIKEWDITLYKNGETGKSKKIETEINFDEEIVADRMKFIYSSKDPSIAKVDENGKITAKGVGTTYINFTLETKSGSKKNYKIGVTVKQPSIVLKSYKTSLKVGQKSTFKVDLYGIKTIKWISSNSKIATIDKNGKVTAKKAGTVTIKVSGGGCTQKVKLKVVKK